MDIMRSVVGMVVLLAIAFVLPVNKKSISLRTVGAALLLQIAIGGIMLYFPPGKWAVEQAALGVHKVMSYSDAGSAFIFGSLVGPKMDVLFDGAGFIFAFRVLPVIIFVTALISLLYYIGVMGLLIRILGSIFQKALNISKIESFVAVTTIFLGQNEIPAIVKPFIDRMNRNELFTAICSGMASIAGSMMIGYAGMGVPIDYLLAASLMAIPGGILFARILSPATEPSQVTFENLSFSETPPKSIIEAAANGAMTGLKIAAGVATVVMAFVAIIALINGIIGGVGGWFGQSLLTQTNQSGVYVDKCLIVPGENTSSYLSLLDNTGEMLVAINDMNISNAITAEYLAQHREFIQRAKVIVADCNISEEALAWILDNAANVPVFVDPVSAWKCVKVRDRLNQIHTLKPNRLEAETLSGIALSGRDDVAKVAAWFHQHGLNRLVLSMGGNGVYYSDISGENGWSAPIKTNVINVTGAGDAMMAGLASCWVDGMPFAESVRFAQGCSSMALSCEYTNNPDLSIANVISLVENAECLN
jgi:putative pseudouridine transporter